MQNRDPLPLTEVQSQVLAQLAAGRFRSASRSARELRQRSASEGLLDLYLFGCLHQAQLAALLLEPEAGIEAADEIQLLLTRAEPTRGFPAAVSFDALSVSRGGLLLLAAETRVQLTALRDGWNSEAVHETLQRGIEDCGALVPDADDLLRLQSLAAAVHLAADDFDLALRTADSFANQPLSVPHGADLHWSAMELVSHARLLRGDLRGAMAACQTASQLADQTSQPLSAIATTLAHRELLHYLGEGEPRWIEELAATGHAPASIPRFPAGEYPGAELRGKLRDALKMCVEADFEAALRELAYWDRHLGAQRCTELWLEVRLRIIAAHYLSGKQARAAPLVGQLITRAQMARDWLTLRRLNLLVESSFRLCPVPLLAPLPEGPFADPSAARPSVPEPQHEPRTAPLSPGDRAAAARPGASTALGAEGVPFADLASDALLESASPPPPPEPTPLEELRKILTRRFESSGGNVHALAALLRDVLNIPLSHVGHAGDAAWMIRLAHSLAALTDRIPEAWQWAERLASAFPQAAAVQNGLADLGATLWLHVSDAERFVEMAALDRLFLDSLALDREVAHHFYRAGEFFRQTGRVDEAERALARAFRLDRGNAHLALALGDLYSAAQRHDEMLTTFTLAVRAGASDPQLLSTAGLAALDQHQYAAALEFFDLLENADPNQPWTQYYRALALLRLERPHEALLAIGREQERNPAAELAIRLVTACACASMGNATQFARELRNLLAYRLADAVHLTDAGLQNLFGQLYRASVCLPDNAPEKQHLETIMLQAGLAPESMFDDRRRTSPPQPGLDFFVCRVRQPLDSRWSTSPGCLSGQESWTVYVGYWGVLATSSEAASALALDWQSRCYPLPAEIDEVIVEAHDYFDSPGVVWQSLHHGLGPEPMV